MSTVIKSFLSILLIVLTVVLSAGIISVAVDVMNARDYHSACINTIENSNHAQSVIEACEKEAEKNGYELEVSKYMNNDDSSSNNIITKVVLKYKYSIGLLNIDSDKEIVGYAR